MHCTCTKQIRFGDLGSLAATTPTLPCLQYMQLQVAYSYLPDFIWLKEKFFKVPTCSQLGAYLNSQLKTTTHSCSYLYTLSYSWKCAGLTRQLANNTYLVGYFKRIAQPPLDLLGCCMHCTCTKQIRFGDLGSLAATTPTLPCLQYMQLQVAYSYLPDFIWLKEKFFKVPTCSQLGAYLNSQLKTTTHSCSYLYTLSYSWKCAGLTRQLANNTYLVGQLPSQLFSLV